MHARPAVLRRLIAAVRRQLPVAFALGCCALPAARAADDAPAAADALFQTTYVYQRKLPFAARYSGANSLGTAAEGSYSLSATAYLGLRLAPGWEVYADPELVQGRALSGLQGLGSLSNGELAKVSGSGAKIYLARLFVRGNWALGDERESVERDQNQLAGTQAKDRITLTAGKMAVTDVFDANAYAHDARRKFLATASLQHGAFDAAADAQGYSWGAALEWTQGAWTLRAGRYALPEQANGESLDFDVLRYYGDQFELERRHEFGGQPGAVRLLAWRNRARMGSYDAALALAQARGGTPDVADVRRADSKRGWGVHLEQALGADVGGFLRYSWADGQTEEYAFEEVDRSLQLGLQLGGALWRRGGDSIGLLWMRNGLAPAHRRYLAAGGLGFFIGDGQLNYAAEQVAEAYYSLALRERLWLAADAQYIRNPAYNADRGPVRLWALRLHAEF